ncbi:MAG: hypothetical protein JNN28_21130 [Saprospiraceae bacterium]|nr:hypothetical protein [Saprospiraceae bacterium]
MKKHLFQLLGLVALALLTQTAQAQNTAQKAPWKEMKEFHEVMSVTFHSAEEKNFAPLKEKSGLLVERAMAWKKSTIPAGFKPELTAQVLKRLVKECKKVDKMVKKGKSDEELMKGINAAHDVFHEIVGKCRE